VFSPPKIKKQIPGTKAKKRLVLHVGTHKTGTSFLQKLFMVNRQFLESESVGLADPMHELLGDHHYLVSFLEQGDEGFQNFLAGVRTGHDCTLVSSECMLTWLMNSPDAAALPALLEPFFEVSVVLYLRRQDYFKESVFAEVATTWYQGDIQTENHYCYDYSQFVDRIVEIFGAESLRLGVYRDDQPQDLAADFLSLAGLEHLIGRLSPITPERVSHNRRQVALLAPCPKKDPGRYEQLRQVVLEPGRIAADSSKYQLSPQERREFLEPYTASNRRIARAFRPEAEAYLADDHPRPEDWSPVAPYTPIEVAGLMAALMADR
jgi:hypothetical protein